MRRILAISLLSSFALTAAAAAPKPANDAAATTTRPVSTGVTNPKLIHSNMIEIPAQAISDAFPNPSRVILKVNLDETGTPQKVQVLQAITQEVDSRVVAAVKQFRWAPAVLDNQPIPVDLKLVVEVTR
jgi:periplasmic protein TonB